MDWCNNGQPNGRKTAFWPVFLSENSGLARQKVKTYILARDPGSESWPP